MKALQLFINLQSSSADSKGFIGLCGNSIAFFTTIMSIPWPLRCRFISVSRTQAILKTYRCNAAWFFKKMEIHFLLNLWGHIISRSKLKILKFDGRLSIVRKSDILAIQSLKNLPLLNLRHIEVTFSAILPCYQCHVGIETGKPAVRAKLDFYVI